MRLANDSTKKLVGHPAVTKAVAAIAVYEGATQIYNTARNIWRSKFAYTITVTQGDPIYGLVRSWLLRLMPDEKPKAIVVSASNRDNVLSSMDVAADDSEVKQLQVLMNETRPRTVDIDGFRVSVVLEKPESTGNFNMQEDPNKIVFTCYSQGAQQAVLTHLARINSSRGKDRKPVLNMVASWGNWKQRSDLPTRDLASVALPAEQKDRIVSDLERFLTDESRYNRLATPWHRGYMFHGPPGTGKTSLVRALASEFGLDLWYISLSDLKAESSLMGLLAEVSPRSMLLLEDIDTIQITHERDTSQGTISMSALLNALDGVATPHGLITMMSTNHFDKLDPALTRAGRMDMVEKINYPTLEVVRDLFRHFYGRDMSFKGIEDEQNRPLDGLSTAEVAEGFKRYLNDPVRAENDFWLKYESMKASSILNVNGSNN